MAQKEFSDSPPKSRRINGEERQALIKQLIAGYGEGKSIRALAASVDRSYGFVHRVLSESGVALRKRGGRRTQSDLCDFNVVAIIRRALRVRRPLRPAVSHIGDMAGGVPLQSVSFLCRWCFRLVGVYG